MAQLAVSTVGAVLGGVVGSIIPGVGTSMGASLGWLVGSYVGGVLFPADNGAKDQANIGPRLQDLKVQVSTYGAAIPYVRGTVRISGNVIWSTGLQEHRVVSERSQRTGGKGGGKKAKITEVTYYYTASFAVGLCEGEMGGISRIWADGKLLYDVTGTSPVAAKPGFDFTFHPGSESQPNDPIIEALQGTQGTPAYRGLCYVVVKDLLLTDYGNRIPQLSFEVFKTGVEAYPVTTVEVPNGALTQDDELLDPANHILYHRAGGKYWAVNTLDMTAAQLGYQDDESGLLVKAVGIDATGGIITAKKSAYIHSRLVRLDPVTLRQDAQSPDEILRPYLIACSRDPLNPFGYVGCMLGEGVKMFITKSPVATAVDLRLVGSSACPSGLEARALTVRDSDGAGFVLFTDHWNGPGVVLRRIVPHPVYGMGLGGATLDVTFTETDIPTGGHINYAAALCYDEETGCLLLSGQAASGDGGLLLKIDAATGDIKGVLKAGVDGAPANLVAMTGNDSAFRSGPSNGRFFVRHGITFHEIDTRAWRVVRSFTEASYSLSSDGFVYDPVQHALLVARRPTGMSRLPLDRVMGQGYPVAAIVRELAAKADVSSGALDLTQVPDIVPGYIVARPMMVRQAVEPLMVVYLFDAAESGGKLRCVKRGGAPIASIPFADLAARESGEEPKEPLTTTRVDAQELPGSLTVQYMLAAQSYEQDTKRAARQVVDTQQTQDVQLPMVLSQEQAARTAEVLLYNTWTERQTYQFSIGRRYFHLEPCDVVQVTDVLGTVHTVRLVKCDLGAPGLLHVEAVREEPSIYDAVSGPGDQPPPDGEIIEYDGPTLSTMMDIPALRDAENTCGFYFAASGLLREAWHGCTVYVSKDSGATWQALAWTSVRAVMGVAVNALGPGPATIWDDWNTLTVRLQGSSDTLDACTETQALAGATAAYLQGEVISWQNATLNADGTYTLSRLLRGRRGTEAAISGHRIGDGFVLLDPHLVERFGMDTADIGCSHLYKVVSSDGLLSTARAVAWPFGCAALKPPAPVHIRGRLQANGDVILSWTPRARFNGEWRDLVESVQTEPQERYTVEVRTLAGSLVRTVESLDTPGHTYSAASIVADLGGLGAGFHVTIYQQSQTTGRGFPGTAVITGA